MNEKVNNSYIFYYNSMPCGVLPKEETSKRTSIWNNKGL
jgi:hypothetical protein